MVPGKGHGRWLQEAVPPATLACLAREPRPCCQPPPAVRPWLSVLPGTAGLVRAAAAGEPPPAGRRRGERGGPPEPPRCRHRRCSLSSWPAFRAQRARRWRHRGLEQRPDRLGSAGSQPRFSSYHDLSCHQQRRGAKARDEARPGIPGGGRDRRRQAGIRSLSSPLAGSAGAGVGSRFEPGELLVPCRPSPGRHVLYSAPRALPPTVARSPRHAQRGGHSLAGL